MKFFDFFNYAKRGSHAVTIGANAITLTGSSGTANITVGGVTALATFEDDLTTTAANFVEENYDAYLHVGIRISSALAVISFAPTSGWKSSNDISATISAAVSGDLTGTVAGALKVDFGKARIWRATFGQPITISAPTNMRDGEEIWLELKATGNYAVTWNAAWQFAGGTEHTQTNGGLDILQGRYNAATGKVYIIGQVKDVKA